MLSYTMHGATPVAEVSVVVLDGLVPIRQQEN